MRSRFYVLIIFLTCLSWQPVLAQALSAEQEYAQLIEQAKTMPQDYNFVKLREVYSQLESYRPYNIQPTRDFRDIFKRLEEGDKSAIADMDAYVEKNFAIPEAHSRAMTAYKSEGNEERRAFHEWATRGLMKALYDSGDGKSAKTARKVLIVSEEYLVARQVMEQKTIGQSLANENGRIYDVLTGKNIKTGELMSLWFDVTGIFAAKMD